MMHETHIRELMRRAYKLGQANEWGTPFTVEDINELIQQYNDERKVL